MIGHRRKYSSLSFSIALSFLDISIPSFSLFSFLCCKSKKIISMERNILLERVTGGAMKERILLLPLKFYGKRSKIALRDRERIYWKCAVIDLFLFLCPFPLGQELLLKVRILRLTSRSSTFKGHNVAAILFPTRVWPCTWFKDW